MPGWRHYAKQSKITIPGSKNRKLSYYTKVVAFLRLQMPKRKKKEWKKETAWLHTHGIDLAHDRPMINTICWIIEHDSLNNGKVWKLGENKSLKSQFCHIYTCSIRAMEMHHCEHMIPKHSHYVSNPCWRICMQFRSQWPARLPLRLPDPSADLENEKWSGVMSTN